MSQSPPAYMTVSTTTQVAAVVTNDVANAGVDWVATCNSPTCGTFNPSHTGPGQNTSYTAPAGVPLSRKVSVTALSTTDHSKAAASSVVIASTVTGITLTPYPPASLPAGALVRLGAAVAGDPANLGVDWTATCNTANGPVTCSSSGLHSDAGGTVSFVVPQTITVPGTVQTQSLIGTSITVTGYATADHNYYASSTFTVTDPITISITQEPPATMLTNAKASVVAVVTNDTTNAGVTWLVDCLSAPCGTITPTQSASGMVATFTAPPIIPSSNPPSGLQVTITAYATAAGTSVQSSVTVNIVAPIAVKITQGITNNTIIHNASTSLAATVANDSATAGVDWTVACGSPGACGAFAPTHTASGAQTTYTAPSAVPAGGTVTIIATSTTDPTKNDQQSVTVTNAAPPNSLLQGQFVLSLSARNSQNGPYVLGGVISGDGNGTITGGVVDLADGAGNATSGVTIISPSSTSPGSTYSIGSDGRGQIHLIINTFGLNHFGVPGAASTGTITLGVVFVTPQHARLAEIDAFGSAIGTLDRQDATALASFRNGSIGLNGTYSLQLSGTQAVSPYPGYFLTSAMAIQASGTSYTLTGYITDQSAAGAITSVPFTTVPQAFPAGSAPDQNGEISTSLGGINLGLTVKFSLDLWIIDATHFVVTDYRDPAIGNPNILVIGYLTADPSPSLSGTYAFTEAGASTAAQPLVAGGIFTCGSTGTLDVFPLNQAVVVNQSISTTCSAPANGRGLISIAANSSGISQFAAYPTVDRGVYLIELDGGGPSGAGVALQQTSNPISGSMLNGNYAAVFSASTAPGSENFTAQVVANGVNTTLSGTADVNSFNTTPAPGSGTPSPGASLSGPFTTMGISNGRFPSTLTLTPASGQPAPQIPVLHPAFYVVDPSTCLLLGLDGNAPGTGIMQLQNTGL